MRIASVVAGASLLLGACSILYNPNNIDRGSVDARPDSSGDDAMVEDAPIDTPPDMPIDMLIDVPPGQLAIDATEPPMVNEGTGNGGSRDALVLLDVRNLEAGTPVITVDPIMDDGMMKPVPISARIVATDRAQIALALKIPILVDTNEGQTKQFGIRVEQPNDSTNFATTMVTVVGLDQFAPAAGTIDTATLKSLYSSITINGAVHFVGANPAFLRSTTNATINAIVDVNAIGATPGASGCAGGVGGVLATPGTPSAGGCGVGGGLPGANGNSADGGGGGFGTVGSKTVMANSGSGGQTTGDALLVTLSAAAGTAANRGNGGGGGGALLGGGGAAGAGAGAMEITADGALAVGTNGRVQANGGGGAGPGGVGAGGGGSGGAIIVRASTITQGTTGWASAAGGNGGAGAANKGGSGRIRIDTTTADIASMVSSITPARGVMWATDTPQLVSTATPALNLIGGATQPYGFSLNGGAVTGIITNASGTVDPAATLVRGINTLCATVGATVGTGQVSSTRCVTMIYVP